MLKVLLNEVRSNNRGMKNKMTWIHKYFSFLRYIKLRICHLFKTEKKVLIQLNEGHIKKTRLIASYRTAFKSIAKVHWISLKELYACAPHN